MNARNPSEEQIFAEALRLSGSEERAAYLEKACGGDEPLRQSVKALLQAYDRAGGFLQQPPPALSGKTVMLSAGAVPISEKPGDKIGHYKLRERIGEGGCGVVYVAEQEEPVRRRVALKIIKLGMDTKQVVARFEAERQALALMDHPNISKVLDAGATDTGRPYFVMELVRGIRITDYCDQNNLSTEERLDLFIKVCSAIQHAHQKGIIHRDIKPSNILVTLHDGLPVPKVIDFGIAKATTDQPLTNKTIYTAFEQFIGTPAYMSPEQAEMSGLDIDTRSDIYALGVLLYELLTGKTPFDAKRLVEAGLDGIRRIIREEEPPRPSTKFSTLTAEEQTTTAKRRHTDPPRLIHLVRGDLDWIVMECLEKDRTRRYETANGLAADLQRHLNNEPVVARPPSSLYRFQKLVRRNKLVFAAASAVTAALLLGLAASTWLLIKETEARRRADAAAIKERDARRQADAAALKSQQVAQFLQDMLKGVGPSVALGRDTTMLREILDKTAERVSKDLGGQPAVEVELRTTIGNVYFDLGEYAKAEAIHRAALALRKKLVGNEHPDVAASLYDLAWVLMRQGKLAEAEMLFREALALRKKLLGNEHPDVAASLDCLGLVLASQGKLAEAETMHRQVLAMRKKLLGNEHPGLGISFIMHAATLLASQGKLAEAETMYREALAMERNLLGKEHPGVAFSLNYLALVLSDQGKLAEAETTYREALAMRKKLLGNEHPDVADSLNNLASVLARQGKFGEAAPRLAEAVKLNPNDHWLWYLLAPLLVENRDPEGYRAHCQAMLARFGATTNAEIAERTAKVCLLLPLDGANLVAATKLAETAVTIGKDDPGVAYYQFAKGLAEYRQPNFPQAAEWTQKALGQPGTDYSRDIQAYSVLAMALHRLNQAGEAREALSKATELAGAKLPKLDSGDLGLDWHDWIIAQTLLRQAKALIEGGAKAGDKTK